MSENVEINEAAKEMLSFLLPLLLVEQFNKPNSAFNSYGIAEHKSFAS